MSLRHKLSTFAGAALILALLSAPALVDSPMVREAYSDTFNVPMILEIKYLSHKPSGPLSCARTAGIDNYYAFIDRLAKQYPGFITHQYSARQNCDGGWLVELYR